MKRPLVAFLIQKAWEPVYLAGTREEKIAFRLDAIKAQVKLRETMVLDRTNFSCYTTLSFD